MSKQFLQLDKDSNAVKTDIYRFKEESKWIRSKCDIYSLKL